MVLSMDIVAGVRMGFGVSLGEVVCFVWEYFLNLL